MWYLTISLEITEKSIVTLLCITVSIHLVICGSQTYFPALFYSLHLRVFCNCFTSLNHSALKWITALEHGLKPPEKQPLWSSLKSNQTRHRRRIKVDWGAFWQIQCVWPCLTPWPLSKSSLKEALYPKSVFFLSIKRYNPCRLWRCCKEFSRFLSHEEQSALCQIQLIPKLSQKLHQSP